MKTKTFFIRFFVLIVLLIIIDFSAGLLLDKIFFSQKRKITYGLEQCQEDVVILGSSRAYHHYVPSIISDSLNLSCYNFGMGGQNIYYDYTIIKSILCRYKPKIILLDVISIDCDSTKSVHNMDKLSVFNQYYDINKNVENIINLKGYKERIKLFSFLYKYNSMQFSILRNYLLSDSIDSLKGYIPLHKKMKKKTNRKLVNKKHVIDSLKISYVEKLISICQEEKVDLIILQSPMYKDIVTNINPVEPIKELAKAREGVEFWDYFSDKNFIDSCIYFNDSYHLNDNGARLYTQYVASRLKEYLKSKGNVDR